MSQLRDTLNRRRLERERFKSQDTEPLHDENDDVLAVLEDVDNGNEYYLSIVDSFTVDGREYVAMGSYEPDDGTHREPEFVLMRFDIGPQGEHYYQSIRNRKELNRVFDIFFERYVRQLRA